MLSIVLIRIQLLQSFGLVEISPVNLNSLDHSANQRERERESLLEALIRRLASFFVEDPFNEQPFKFGGLLNETAFNKRKSKFLSTCPESLLCGSFNCVIHNLIRSLCIIKFVIYLDPFGRLHVDSTVWST